MYCSNCGAKAAGNFCAQCGARLGAPASPEPPVSRDWQHEVRYAALLEFPVVRDLLARYAARAHKGLSSEAFIELCEKVYQPIPGVSISKLASIIAPVYDRMGIRTGKTRTEVLAMPVGKTLVAVLCSLAQHGWTLKDVQQAEDGCVLQALLPSDFRSFEGEIVVAVRTHEPGTQVEAATKIPGQLFDWGKSRQCLQTLFTDLHGLATTPLVA